MIRNNKLEAFAERCLDDHRPITADIFLTNYCNLRCSYCRYSHANGEYMSFNDFVLYANRLLQLGVKAFILTGGGEPTVNPDFGKITSWLEENDIPYGINTNLIRPIKCNPVFLKISIDTGIPSEFALLRGKDALSIVFENIKDFCEDKRERNLRTNIGVQCVATSKTNVLSFYEKVNKLDVDYIYIRPLEGVNVGERIKKETIKEWLSPYLDDPRLNISYKFDLMDYRPNKCHASWSVINVDHKGFVKYCCHLPNATVGHILDNDILEKKCRYKINTDLCETPCRLSGQNKFMEKTNFDDDIFFI